MRVRPMHSVVATVLMLCMMQIAETTTALQQPNDRNESEFPKDVVNKIAAYLKDDKDKLVLVLYFFSKHNPKIINGYIETLRMIIDKDKIFEGLVDELVKDIGQIKIDPDLLRITNDIWNTYVKPSDKINDGAGQKFDFYSNILPALTFTLSTLPNPFTSTEKDSDISLAAVQLSFQAIYNLHLWWEGKISGEYCAKYIIDNCATVAGGVGGGWAGAAIGSQIYPGIGTVVGRYLGEFAGSAMSRSLSDWLTQKIFHLPKEAALENAYKFLGLEYGASNTQINSSFKYLALKYHPDKGGTKENWYTLQSSMAIIKLSKGKI